MSFPPGFAPGADDGCCARARAAHQQAKEQKVKEDRRLFLVRVLAPQAVLLFADNLFHDGLVQTTVRDQLGSFVIHRLQQHLSRSVDKTDPAEIHVEFFLRRRGAKFAPALFEGGHVLAHQAALDTYDGLGLLLVGSYSKHVR